VQTYSRHYLQVSLEKTALRLLQENAILHGVRFAVVVIGCRCSARHIDFDGEGRDARRYWNLQTEGEPLVSSQRAQFSHWGSTGSTHHKRVIEAISSTQ
jgi:hypothetical protein